MASDATSDNTTANNTAVDSTNPASQGESSDNSGGSSQAKSPSVTPAPNVTAGQGFRALTDRWTPERIERVVQLLHAGDREALIAYLDAEVPRVPHSTDPPDTIDMKGIDFGRLGYKVDLGRVHFDRLNMWSSVFREVNLKGAKFTKCAMGQTSFSNAYMREAHFVECDLHGNDFERANLLKVRFEKTKLRFSTWVDCEVDMDSFVDGLEEEQTKKWGLARDIYRALRLNFTSGGDEKGSSWAAYKQSVMQRYDLKARKQWFSWFVSTILDLAWGYGEKPVRLFGFAVGVILFFALGYFFIGLKIGDNCITGFDAPSGFGHYFECVYYSCMTFFTVGYGDIVPCTTPSRLLAIGESFGGVFLMGLFVTANARKLEGR